MKRRKFLSAGSSVAWASLATLSGCGGGGGGAPAPTPAPAPAPTPAPTPAPAPTPTPAPVNGPAWSGLGRDAQHTAVSAIATQNLNRIGWSTSVDLAPQYTGGGALLAHYGSPVITTRDTVVIPVKTGPASGFRVEARSGGNGALLWSQVTDYVMPAHNWVPGYNVALTPSNRVYAPGAGGKLLVRLDANDPAGTFASVVFYGAAAYLANAAAFDSTVFINTPVTSDANGNLFFGFVVTGANPAGLASGIARVDAAGFGTWVAATAIAADATIAKPTMNCAPALSPDGATVYVSVNSNAVAGTPSFGYLIALDSTTLAARQRVLLLDPATGLRARVDDNGTSSPAVAPDGRVFFGVLENPFASHNARGWLLQFTAQLASAGAPGSFGWDVTPSVIPASMVPSHPTGSAWLVAVKYNNYEGLGSGTGANQLAVLDPSQAQADAITPAMTVMKEVRTIVGVTFETGSTVAVKEWCINTMAADPFTNSIIANSEDGVLYRWHLPSNTFTQSIRITNGLGEAYTPTAIGADGTVYAIGNATLFAIKS